MNPSQLIRSGHSFKMSACIILLLPSTLSFFPDIDLHWHMGLFGLKSSSSVSVGTGGDFRARAEGKENLDGRTGVAVRPAPFFKGGRGDTLSRYCARGAMGVSKRRDLGVVRSEEVAETGDDSTEPPGVCSCCGCCCFSCCSCCCCCCCCCCCSSSRWRVSVKVASDFFRRRSLLTVTGIHVSKFRIKDSDASSVTTGTGAAVLDFARRCCTALVMEFKIKLTKLLF
jgi:hypothetical protein